MHECAWVSAHIYLFSFAAARRKFFIRTYKSIYIYIFVFPCPFLNFSFFLFFGHKIGTSKSGKFKLQQRNSKCKQLKKKGEMAGGRENCHISNCPGVPKILPQRFINF